MSGFRTRWSRSGGRALRIGLSMMRHGPRRVIGARRAFRRQLDALRSSPLFDADWYIRTYPDVAACQLDPAEHFLRHGMREARSPGPAFDGDDYLARYPDVARSGLHPLLHYLLHGQAEHRQHQAVLPAIVLAPRLPAHLAASLAVPFAAPLPVLDPPPRIAVLLHLYYVDLAEEFLEFLNHIPGPADLFVTTTSEAHRATLLAVFAGWRRGAVQVLLVPNRGRDIAPKIVALAGVNRAYDLCLHVHGKKSVHWQHGDAWRRYLLDTLLGSEGTVRSILAAFVATPDLGMVFPRVWGPLEGAINWGYEFERARALAQRMGIVITPDAPLEFPAGSMFWVRGAALGPLLQLGLSHQDFPVEDGLIHGSLAHAIERLFLHVCEAAGYRWVSIAPDRADTGDLIRIASAEDVSALLDRRGHPLLLPSR